MDELQIEVPIITGFLLSAAQPNITTVKKKLEKNNSHLLIQTRKWCVYIQNIIKEYENNKVLIIDDYVASGNFLYAFTERLTKEL